MKLYYKILYCILILFYQKTKKIVILILFNIIDHIKSKNTTNLHKYNINLYVLKIAIASYTLS